ncbi:MAG: ATP synthase subunit I, partial [Candidatus Hydrogenedentes bacterium]|nr:ATP synthase subunit I [Candidatus Hydrogenedentota bacterium]
MEPLRRFRLMTVRLALLLTAVATAVAYPLNVTAAKGILAGGIGGVLAFWVVALRVEKLALAGDGRVKSIGVRWTLFRLAVYALVLGWACS